MAEKRDNFSKSTIQTLERRVNGKCSNPDHRVPTSGPNTSPEASVNIGQAAHICAASVGGPRFDPNMTSTERSSVENGIWLCSNCAAKIDRDVKKHTVELLKLWKESAELRAQEELGNIPISRERYNELENLVFNPGKILPGKDQVAVACQLTAEYLERRDSRFEVQIERINNRTRYCFRAKEPVSFSLKVAPDNQQEFAEKFTRLLEHAQEMQISASAISVEGLPMSEQLDGEAGYFVLAPAKQHKSSVVVELGDTAGENYRFFAEILGDVAVGTQSMRFTGQALDGLLEATFTLPRDLGDITFSISHNLAMWDKKILTTLPHFERLYSFYSSVRSGALLRLTIEIEGRQAAVAQGKFPSENIQNFSVLRYASNARLISEALLCPVSFNHKEQIAGDDFDAVEELRLRLEAQGIDNIHANAMVILEASPDDVEKNSFIASPMDDFVIEQTCTDLALFGQMLPPFKLITKFSKALLQATERRTSSGGQEFEIVPLPGCDFSSFVEKISEIPGPSNGGG